MPVSKPARIHDDTAKTLLKSRSGCGLPAKTVRFRSLLGIDAMPFDRHGSDILDEVECRKLLEHAGATGTVGRLAISREGAPHVIPVNFSVCDETILIRLRPGFAAHHLDGATVTFEIDHAEPYSRKGWSVEVEGPATLLTYEEAARLGHNVPQPLVMSPGMRVFSIRFDRISGRSIRHDHEETSPPPSSDWTNRDPEGDGGMEGPRDQGG